MFKQLLNNFKRSNLKELKTFNKALVINRCEDCGTFFCDAKNVCELLEIEDAEWALKQLDPDMKNEMFLYSDDEDWNLSESDKRDTLTIKGLFALVFQAKTPFANYIQSRIADEFVEKICSKECELLPAGAEC